MAFSNRKDQSGVTSSQVITLIQSKVKIQQAMVGALAGNTVFTVPNGDSVFNNMITIFVGGGENELGSGDYTINSPTQITLTHAPSTQPYCSYVAQ